METDHKEPPVYMCGKPLASEHRGRCFSCGFLRRAVETQAGTEYREIDCFARSGLEPWLVRIQTDVGREVQPTLECVIGIRDVSGEVSIEAGFQPHEWDQDQRFERARRIVTWKDIKCPRWRLYTAGKSVQQYYAEDFMLDLEKLRQQFQEDWENRRQEFHLDLAKRDEQMQLQRADAQRQTGKVTTRITVVGLVFALAQVLTLTKDSVLWKVIAWLYHLLAQ